MPHVVIGDPGQREARISGSTITEHYLGVLVATSAFLSPMRPTRFLQAEPPKLPFG